jgi:SAM-dependent methyltransferase
MQLKALREEDRLYRSDHPDVIAPSADLRYNVVGPCNIPQFLISSSYVLNDIENALQTINRTFSDFRTFLDFGCGCGRLLLGLRDRADKMEITGCDVDSRAIRWCQENIEYAKSVVLDELPPSPFERDEFDLIWCGSVFTHLDKEHQDQWLNELQRILKPGGILIATLHGPHTWESRLPKWTIAKLKEAGIIFARTNADFGVHPGWYQVAWHTEDYIRDHWETFFTIRSYIPRGSDNNQDVVVAQKN